MTALLYCKTGALAGSEYRIGDDAVIGRQEENDVTLPSDAVSGRHARIFFDDENGRYVLEDLEGSTGTQLDATEVVDAVPLDDLHVITFGQSVDVIFQVVEAEVGAASKEQAPQTQFGVAPEAPADFSDEDEADGERTRMGGASGALPDLSEEEADAAPEQTRFGESPPELPDLSEESASEEGDPERTQFGQAPDSLPDLSDEDSASESEESPSPDVEQTRFGESPPELPDLTEGDDAEGERTRMGDAPESLPDLGDEDAATEGEEDAPPEVEQTRFGESPPELPDLTEEDESEGDRTRMAEEPGTLPDFSGDDATESGDPVSQEEEDPPSGDESGEDDVEKTKMGAAAPGLPDVSEDEPPSEDDVEDLSDAPTQAAPDPDASSPQYALRVTLEDEPQDTYPLPEGEVTIGRSSECDIEVEDPGVSREHARFVIEAGEVVVDDMGSKNFTFVDGNRLSGPTTLSHGSQLQFGLHVKAVLQRVPSS